MTGADYSICRCVILRPQKPYRFPTSPQLTMLVLTIQVRPLIMA